MFRRVIKPGLLPAILFGLVLMTGSAAAQEEALLDQIGLTPAQRGQIKTLREQFVKDTDPLRAEIRRLVEDENRLKAAARPDEAALRKKLQERADKEIELSLALMRFREKLKAVLTPQQRKKLESLGGR